MPGPESSEYIESPFLATDPEVSPERRQEPSVDLVDGPLVNPSDTQVIVEPNHSIMAAVLREAGAPVTRGNQNLHSSKVPGAELSPGSRRKLHEALAEIDRSETGPGIYR